MDVLLLLMVTAILVFFIVTIVFMVPLKKNIDSLDETIQSNKADIEKAADILQKIRDKSSSVEKYPALLDKANAFCAGKQCHSVPFLGDVCIGNCSI